ncbi:MAG: YbhB/YbcL family Raf kinase inhibitor-like protein [Rhodocyclaceae bacterium]
MSVRLNACLLLLSCPAAYATDFSLSSPGWQDGATLPLEQVACGGKNLSPALQWHNAPAGTKSFAVTVYDPDAPTMSGWWHWQLYNIPASVNALPANAGDPAANLAPAGAIQNVNDGGKPGYAGACPPRGDKPHRYVFTVFALPDEAIKAPATASNAMIGFNLLRNALGRASLTLTYGRP